MKTQNCLKICRNKKKSKLKIENIRSNKKKKAVQKGIKFRKVLVDLQNIVRKNMKEKSVYEKRWKKFKKKFDKC